MALDAFAVPAEPVRFPSIASAERADLETKVLEGFRVTIAFGCELWAAIASAIAGVYWAAECHALILQRG
jgi:hypothetical protein